MDGCVRHAMPQVDAHTAEAQDLDQIQNCGVSEGSNNIGVEKIGRIMWKLITVVTINAKTRVGDCNKNNKNQEQPIYESSESNDYSATT